jgi:hypothetical protein
MTSEHSHEQKMTLEQKMTHSEQKMTSANCRRNQGAENDILEHHIAFACSLNITRALSYHQGSFISPGHFNLITNVNHSCVSCLSGMMFIDFGKGIF